MSGTPSVPGTHTVTIIMCVFVSHILPLLVACFVCSNVGPHSLYIVCYILVPNVGYNTGSVTFWHPMWGSKALDGMGNK